MHSIVVEEKLKMRERVNETRWVTRDETRSAA